MLLSALALVMAIAGCAYFNTFYNARQHFNKAQRAQSSAETDAGPNVAAIREYDLTIEKCNKVIQDHAGSRWVDDAVLLMGRAYFGKREYAQALDKFRALVSSFPDSDLRAEALYMTGVAYYNLNRREEGRLTFEQLLREYQGFARRDQMLRIQAEALEREGELEEAITVFRRIVDDYPDSDQRVETLFDIGELYMRTGVFDRAYEAYDEALGAARTIENRLEARRRRADALFREKRYAEALDTYRTVLDVGTNLSRAEIEPIELRIAACINELGDHERAITEYRRVSESSSGAVAAAEALFSIGLIRELDHGDYEAALQEYDAIKRLQGAGSRSIFATQAESRGHHLRRLIEKGITSRDAGGDSDEAAQGKLYLAEQFLFQQADTTEAIARYGDVEAAFPDTPEGRKACYAQAYLMDLTHAAPESTLAKYLQILTRYPGTPQAIAVGDRLHERGLQDLIPEGALEPVVTDSVAVVDSVLSPEGAPADSGDVVPQVPDTMVVIGADSLRVLDPRLHPGVPLLGRDRFRWDAPDSLARPDSTALPGSPGAGLD